MKTIAIQRKLPLSVRVHAPLMTVDAARQQLGAAADRAFDEDDIRYYLEEGKLFGWNIASPGATRSEVRILPWSVASLISEFAGTGTLSVPAPAEVIELALPATTFQGCFRSTQLSAHWVCGGTHILDLCDDRELIEARGSERSRGRNGAALITKASVVAFLKKRSGLE